MSCVSSEEGRSTQNMPHWCPIIHTTIDKDIHPHSVAGSHDLHAEHTSVGLSCWCIQGCAKTQAENLSRGRKWRLVSTGTTACLLQSGHGISASTTHVKASLRCTAHTEAGGITTSHRSYWYNSCPPFSENIQCK